MMKVIKPYLLIIFVFSLQLAACTRPRVRPEEGVPDVEPTEEIPLEKHVVPNSLEGEYCLASEGSG